MILLFRFIVSFGILGTLLYLLPLANILTSLKTLPTHVWLTTIGCFLAGHILASQKWRFVLTRFNVATEPLTAIKAHLAGLFANICLPSIVGGDIVRAAIVVKKEKKLEQITAAGIVDRIVDTLALIIIMAIAALFIEDYPVLRLSLGNSSLITVLITTFGLLTIIAWIVGRRWFATKANGLKRLFQNTQLTRYDVLLTLLISVLIQCFFIGLNINLATNIGIATSAAVWFFCWPVAKLVALAPVSLGGLGVRDAAIVMLLGTYGVSMTDAFAQSLSWQATLIIAGIVSGVVAMLSVSKSGAAFISSRQRQQGNYHE